MMDEHRESGRVSLCLKNDWMESEFVHIKFMFSCGRCFEKSLFSSDVIFFLYCSHKIVVL